MRIASLFSGGKDSVYALGWALAKGYEAILVTMDPQEYSMMFHHPNVKWTKLQAEAIGVKQVVVKTTHEKELEDLEKALGKLKKENGIEGITTGAVASKYQKDRIEAICKRLGLECFSPLWHAGNETLDKMVSEMEIYIVAVAAEGLGKEWLGKPFSELRSEMKKTNPKIKNIHPFLEGGEGETFVCNAPFFKKRILIKGWKIQWDGVRGVAEIENAVLIEKV
ncbi:MAG: diphthine--ammonia ligase [Candidatus Micrarchaeia archaeon]